MLVFLSFLRHIHTHDLSLFRLRHSEHLFENEIDTYDVRPDDGLSHLLFTRLSRHTLIVLWQRATTTATGPTVIYRFSEPVTGS